MEKFQQNYEVFSQLGNLYLGALGADQDYSKVRIYYEIATKH